MEHSQQSADRDIRIAQEENSLLTAHANAAALLDNEQPRVVCERTGALFEDGEYCLDFMDRTYRIGMPGAVFAEPRDITIVEVLLLHYLTTTGNHPAPGSPAGFASIPGAMFYFPSFKRRALDRLVSAFGTRPDELGKAISSLGGSRWSTGEHSWSIPVFPRIDVICQIFPGDDEFPPDANLLFTDTVSNLLPTEDTAFLGGYVVGRIIKTSTL